MKINFVYFFFGENNKNEYLSAIKSVYRPVFIDAKALPGLGPWSHTLCDVTFRNVYFASFFNLAVEDWKMADFGGYGNSENCK